MTPIDDGRKVFEDARNLEYGQARILYGTATETAARGKYEEGWVLPGGTRTADFEVAHAAVQWIDEQIKAWRSKRAKI